MILLKDNFNRVHDYLRVSLTDKCNLNCIYCNPVKDSTHSKPDVLSFEGLHRVIQLFVTRLGIKKIRFTGGEPFARNEIIKFFESLLPLKEEFNLTLGVTTNGTLINGKLKDIYNAGIDNINISLDTLHPEKFRRITGKSSLPNVLSTIDEALQEDFKSVKINSVIIRGINEEEITDFIEHFKNANVQLRFIEFMPSQNNSWGVEGYISAAELKNIIEKNYTLNLLRTDQHAVSKNYRVNDFPLSVGLITPISDHFCGSCNRLRVTANGEFKSCLFWMRNDDVNFKNLIQYDYTDEDICALVVNALRGKWKSHPGLSKITELQKNNMLKTGG